MDDIQHKCRKAGFYAGFDKGLKKVIYAASQLTTIPLLSI